MDDVLAIIGSVEFSNDHRAGYAAHNFIHNYVVDNPPNKIISGGAAGLDTIGITIANILDIPFKNYYPENPHWEPNGYKARNIEIAQVCTRLLSIRHFNSRTFGSGWTANHAEKLGKNVERYMCNTIYEIVKL
jgi:hypothetical protein